jgi:hypothetical protein
MKYLPGGGSYCITCYRKFVRGKKECKRCHRLRVITANGYCGPCYNVIMGYNERRGPDIGGRRVKRKIKPQKCLFCSENRLEMLEVYRKGRHGDDSAVNFVLLCPNHYREVQLGLKIIKQ